MRRHDRAKSDRCRYGPDRGEFSSRLVNVRDAVEVHAERIDRQQQETGTQQDERSEDHGELRGRRDESVEQISRQVVKDC
jgi:hypothetical protein